MIDSVAKNKIDSFLASIGSIEPTMFDLGTPQLDLTEEMKEIIGIGSKIVPYLLKRMQSASPKEVAYLVFMLRHLDDLRTMEPLRKLKKHYETIERKTEWDFAVIGQCNMVIDRR
ncbi:MAG: hypothetical protein ACE5NW_18735 [Acidiferrobacterales bacterium]